MLHYILQILVFQLLFLILYDLFHKRDTFFVWNRLYLILTPLLSLTLPFIKIDTFKASTPAEYVLEIERVIKTTSDKLTHIEAAEMIFEYPEDLWVIIYLLGIIISSLILILKLHKLKILKTVSLKSIQNTKTIITIPNSNQAFSFWNSIYLGDGLSETSKKQILIHELVHVRHKHSLDQIWYEFLKIICWWNPLIYIYQSRVTLLHEYIADAAVISSNDKRNYIEHLLNATFQTQEITFVNHFFNHSLIKKRILMLQKSKSKSTAKFKYLFLIPVIIGILGYTSSKNESSIANEGTTRSAETSKSNIPQRTKVSKDDTTESTKKIVSTNTQTKKTPTNNIVNLPLKKKKAASKPSCINKNSVYDMKLDNYLKLTVGANTEVIVDVVSLTNGKRIRSKHLEKNVTSYIKNIPEDKYQLHIEYGTGYAEKTIDGVCTGYFKDSKAKKIDKNTLDFTTIKTKKGLNVPSYSLKLDLLSHKMSNN